MKIYNRKDFIFGLIMCLALPGRLLDGVQQWNEGEVGGMLWVAAVLAIAGKYFYNACSKVYNETDTAALELRRRAEKRRFGRFCRPVETVGILLTVLSVVAQFAVPVIGGTVSFILLLVAVVYIIWFEQAIHKAGRKIQLAEMSES